MFKRGKASKLLRQLQMKQLEPEEPEPPPKQDYLSERDCHRTYSCIHCRAHLANHDELISKLFQGNHGRAYLFNKVVNVGCKQAVERELLTGLHAVADIYCDCCETTLGWKYEQAFVPSQKYKEGKYIIELVHMLKENNWDLSSYNNKELLEQQLLDDELAQMALEETQLSTNSARRLPLVDQHQTRETLALNSTCWPAAALATSHRQRVANSRKNISNSSSYTTLRTTQQLQAKLNLNCSGGGGGGNGGGDVGSSGANSDAAASTSTSHENLGQSAKANDETETKTAELQQQANQQVVSCVVVVEAAKQLQDDTNKTTTTTSTTTPRQTIEIEHGQQECAAAEPNSAPISVQQ